MSARPDLDGGPGSQPAKTRRPRKGPAKSGGGSTAAVLWLMIALVFLPLVAIHVGARWVVQAQPAPVTEPAKP